jgi:hypothetical protein
MTRRHSIPTAVRLARVLAAGALLLAATVPARAGGGAWRRASTPHFVLYARADRDSVLRLARNLESMAAMLEREGFGVRSRERQRVTMIAFPDRKEFLPHLPVRDGKRAEVSGLAHLLPWGTWIGFAAYDDRGRMVAHHELLHAIVGAALGSAPLCMNEGLAEFYSTWQAGERGGRFGAPIPWHQWVVRNERPFTLDELFAVNEDSPVYRKDGDSRTLFYAESWAVMHYLMRLDGRSRRFREMALAIADGSAPRRAFAKAYPGENWDELPGRLGTYVDSDHIASWEMRLDAPLTQLPVQVRDASPAEVAAHTGLWRSLESELDAAGTRALLEQGRADDAEPALALAGLGVLARREKRLPEAFTAFRGVAATPDASPLALSVAGAELLMQAVGDSLRFKPLAAEACALLARSVALDSTDAVALGWYGRAALASGQLTPRAMRALETAATALPVDGPVASAWAAALSHSGQAQRAREVLRTHGGLAQNRDMQAATGVTLAFDAFRDSASVLSKAGRYAELERLLTRTENATTDRAMLEALGSVRRQLAEARAQQRNVDRYNEGVHALKASELEKARAAFAAARDSTADPKLKGEAAARLEELAGMIEFDHGMKAYAKKDFAAAAAAFARARDLARTDDLREKAAKNAELMRKALAAPRPARKTAASQ